MKTADIVTMGLSVIAGAIAAALWFVTDGWGSMYIRAGLAAVSYLGLSALIAIAVGRHGE
jgi:hypothetical protein